MAPPSMMEQLKQDKAQECPARLLRIGRTNAAATWSRQAGKQFVFLRLNSPTRSSQTSSILSSIPPYTFRVPKRGLLKSIFRPSGELSVTGGESRRRNGVYSSSSPGTEICPPYIRWDCLRQARGPSRGLSRVVPFQSSPGQFSSNTSILWE
ncbi:hypothetical protein EVAR_16131_1 [Eumeta japonica]|uniref:Uncharacterized protein n=1 Tax=Eumeta variegata TaxID=151549 RepID=A0A4C1UJK3_EUMVA|nr:hypothetical protein EVAR_16131_1 [Eumeta japonica]